MTRQHRLVFTTLLALLLGAPTLHAADAPAFEPIDSWYVLSLGGSKAGHMHVATQREGDTLVTTTDMVLSIKRGDAAIVIEQSTRFVETPDHKPIRTSSRMKLAAMATEQSLDFTATPWTLTTTTAGQSTTVDMTPPKEPWMTPMGMAMHLAQAIAAGEDEIRVTTFDLSSGSKPVTATMKRLGREDIEVFGRVVPATKWQTTASIMPGMAMHQWTNKAGQPVRQTVPLMPGMAFEMLLADKALALADFDAPEMLVNTLITPDKPIKNPRKLKRAVFELVAKDLKKNVGDTVPNDGYQTTQWMDGNTLRLTVDLESLTELPTDEIKDQHLQTSSMLNHKDPKVAELTKQAVSSYSPVSPDQAINRAAIARHLTSAVRNHIQAKDLSVGFASASETARTKQGDCTEHACLLAAMLRGAGIPSRTVTGLVYADQFAGQRDVFGFHMWTQAWIQTAPGKGYWLDLDAALPGDVNGLDATHIALSTSAMKDGETLNDMVTMLPLMQGMTIEVIEAQWAKQPR